MIQRSDGVFSTGTAIEQEQRHSADVSAPHLHRDVVAASRHTNLQGPPARVCNPHHRQALGVGIEPVLVLPPRLVESLLERTLRVQQPEAHRGDALVRLLLQEVAHQHAEAAGVDRQR